MKYRILLVMLFLSNLTQAQKLDYGKSSLQTEILNLDCLHERGFTGKGVTIAHFDDGYNGFTSMNGFTHVRDKGLLKAAYDFVSDSEMVYTGLGKHGTHTISIVHTYLPGTYIGTAPDANLLLARTEDGRSETKKELKNWDSAVNWAIKNKADIITSSLQYNEFDPGEGNFTYADMDGNTTIITKAADRAAASGILVVAIQGNFGNGPWRYVSAPGDADSVLTVGAIDGKGNKAGFSGYGPTYDGRIKPDVLAIGSGTVVIEPDDRIILNNGTSFAAPAMAGLVACLKQAHPKRSNMEIISAVRQSADRYWNPDRKNGFGYGIPDACVADEILTKIDEQVKRAGVWVEFEGGNLKSRKRKIIIKLNPLEAAIMDISLVSTTEQLLKSYSGTKKIKIKKLTAGHYLIRWASKEGKMNQKNIIVP